MKGCFVILFSLVVFTQSSELVMTSEAQLARDNICDFIKQCGILSGPLGRPGLDGKDGKDCTVLEKRIFALLERVDVLEQSLIGAEMYTKLIAIAIECGTAIMCIALLVKCYIGN